MLELLCIPKNVPASLQGSQDSKIFARDDEHGLHDRDVGLRWFASPPRRAQSTHDFQYLVPFETSPATVHQTSSRESVVSSQLSCEQSSPLEPAATPAPANRAISPSRSAWSNATQSRRPKLPHPRRSYSVMDYEPVRPEETPGTNLALVELPSELHMAMLEFLDPIDSTCLGLTNRHFYSIHRRMNGSIPLSARRNGPNELERVWYMAGGVVHASLINVATTTNTLGPNELTALRVRGKALCRKCGIYRCELQRHLQEWMPEGYEYCTIREKFGRPAPEDAKRDCYRSNPTNPRQCGRHRARMSGTESN